ncbi:MAG: hypothetical protein U9P14_07060, partial [Gemmatimonadota bacterium]|nr:hypothetical protein [Gemmatimonadota bacterium]
MIFKRSLVFSMLAVFFFALFSATYLQAQDNQPDFFGKVTERGDDYFIVDWQDQDENTGQTKVWVNNNPVFQNPEGETISYDDILTEHYVDGEGTENENGEIVASKV